MTVDEIVKLVFFIGITISILGISIQIMRIFGKLADMMQDLRPSIKNISDFSTQLVEDYKLLGESIRGIAKSLGDINENVIKPVVGLGKTVKGLTTGFGLFGKKGKKHDED